jgi:hypothetical protein
MAASYVRNTAQGIVNGSNNVTINTTGCNGIVLTFAFSVPTASVTSVSYQGKAGAVVTTKADTTGKCEVWLIPGPESNASGTLTVVLSMASGYCYMTAVMVLAGAEAYANNSGNVSSGALSISCNSDATCLMIGVMNMYDIYTITPGAGQTLISQNTSSGNMYCRTDYKAGAASSTTLSWTPASNAYICGIVVAITVLGAVFACPGMIG